MKFLNSALAVTLLIIFGKACKAPDNIITEGLRIIYFSGTDVVKQRIEYKNGKKHGFMKEYYKDGTLKAIQFYTNDSLDDTTKIYYSDGRLKTLQVYKNKLRHGRWLDYNKDGKLLSEMFFKDDLIDSTCSQFSFRSARLITRIHYSKGLKNGTEEHYYLSGKPKSREYYFYGALCKGTEEWYESGKKINNDFKIFIYEKDAVMLENTLTYQIRIENQGPKDKIYAVLKAGNGNQIGDVYPLQKEGDVFVYKYNISKGSFVMEEITIAAYKKTAMGNTVIKTKSFNVASNNF